MTRTVTLPTLDHGNVTLPEPEWCLGHADHLPCHMVDLAHTGTEHRFAFDGADLLVAMFTQDPHSATPERQHTGLYVEQTGWAATLDYAGLRMLAAALTVHAMHLRTLADALAAIHAKEGQQ